MTVDEIKRAVDAGLPVRWANDGYHVIRDSIGQYLIVFQPNGHTIGLTWQDGVTLNGRPEEFYVAARTSWWVDEGGSLDNQTHPNEVYLCEGEEGDAIRLSTDDVDLARALRDEYNTRRLTRDEADVDLRARGLAG